MFEIFNKNYLITNKNAFCKNKNSINNYENILKFIFFEVEWNEIDIEKYENDWKIDFNYEIDDKSKN